MVPPKAYSAEDRRVGVVGDVDGQVELAAENAGQVDAGPAEVVRVEDHAAPVDHAGRADADAEHRRAGGRAQLLREADREADRLLADRAVECYLGAGLDLAEQVDHRPRHPVGR